MSSTIIKLSGIDPLNRAEPHSDDAVVSIDPARLREFDVLWGACRVSVRAFLSSLVFNKSDVEDCVQEVALIAWKKGPVGEGQRAFLGHCLASARLIGMAASRKSGKSRVQFLPPEVALSLADEVERQEQEEGSPTDRILALRACMSRLDERQRDLLGRRYAGEGRARLDEVAKSEGKTLDALYKTLERLRSSLRDCVTKRMTGGGENS